MNDELKGLAQRIIFHKERIKQLQEGGFLKRLFLLSREKKRLSLLEQIFDDKLKKWLLANNDEFATLAYQNLKLLAKEEITYKTKIASFNPVASYSAYFSGSVHTNGYGYLKYKRALGVYPLAKYDYVSKFLGHIDYLGNIELKPVKIASSLLFTRPRVYEGYVNDKGTIVLNVVRKDLETVSGHVIVTEMIGLHFTEEEKLQQFFENRKRLLEIIERTRQQLFETKQN